MNTYKIAKTTAVVGTGLLFGTPWAVAVNGIIPEEGQSRPDAEHVLTCVGYAIFLNVLLQPSSRKFLSDKANGFVKNYLLSSSSSRRKARANKKLAELDAVHKRLDALRPSVLDRSFLEPPAWYVEPTQDAADLADLLWSVASIGRDETRGAS